MVAISGEVPRCTGFFSSLQFMLYTRYLSVGKAFFLLLFWYLFVAKELPFSCSWHLSSAVEPCSNSVHFLFFKWKHKVFQLMFVCCSRISFGCCGRFTAAELLSFSLSVMLVLIWVLTGHWLLMDGEYVNLGALLLVCACSDIICPVMMGEIC